LVSAQSVSEVRRFFQAGANARDNGFGPVVAANSRIAATGNPAASRVFGGNEVLEGGEVSLFNLTTGRRVRGLQPPAEDAFLTGAGFGAALSFSGNVLAVGAPGNAGVPGRVYLFQAGSGRLLRRIAVEEGGFGASVSLHGNRLLVGSPQEDFDRGAAYLFDLSSPDQPPQRLLAPVRTASDEFGQKVALSPDYAVVTAPFESTTRGFRAGSAYVFNAALPFNLLDRVTDEGISLAHPMGPFSELGSAVAIAGRVVYLSAPGTSVGGITNSGSILSFDVVQRSVVQKVGPFAGSTRFGAVMGCADNLLVAGHGVSASSSPFPSIVYGANDFTAPVQQGTLLPGGLEEGDKLDGEVAVNGNTVVLAVQNSLGTANDGAVFRLRPVQRPALPGIPALRRGDSATGVPGAEFANIDQHLNDFNDFWVLGSLRRPVSRNHGVWGKDGVPVFLRNDALPDAFVVENARLSRLRSIQAVGGRLQIEVTRSGPEITNASNTGFYVREGGLVARGFMKGDVISSQTANFPRLERFVSVGLSEDGNTVIRARLKRDRSKAVNAANDSVVHYNKALSFSPSLQGPVQEADTVAGVTLGEILPRVATLPSAHVIVAAALGAPQQNQAVLHRDHNTSFVTLLVRKGESANLIGGSGSAVFHAFQGETLTRTGDVGLRVRLAGEGVTNRDNQALFLANPGSAPLLAARTGTFINTLPPGVVIRRILSYQRVANRPTFVMLVQLSGVGVRTSNDLALMVASPSVFLPPGSPVLPTHLLLREGDPLPDGNVATIRNILRVAYEDNGDYLVLVALQNRAGEATPATNLALLYGSVSETRPVAEDAPGLRRPFVILRKGWQIADSSGKTVRSLSFSRATVNAQGASGTGTGFITGDAVPLFIMDFGGGERVLWRGGFAF